jgi:hypothetical protein
MKSELDTTDPRKNFWPWIVRTQHGDGDIDINLIVNFFFGLRRVRVRTVLFRKYEPLGVLLTSRVSLLLVGPRYYVPYLVPVPASICVLLRDFERG